MENEILRAALGYAGRGWSVFPCKPRGKEPLTAHGFKDATTDRTTIEAWWRKWPDANIGIATGPETFCALDVDPRHGGDAALEDLLDTHGALPATVTSRTGGGGWHYLFQCPSAFRCRKVAGPGVEVKAVGGYVIVPPSVHESGEEYEWREGLGPEDLAPASLPGWLTEETSHRGNLTGFRILPEAANGGPAEKGTRNVTAASLAGQLIHQGVALDELIEALKTWNSENPDPLAHTELERTARSIWRTHHRNHSAAGSGDIGDFGKRDLWPELVPLDPPIQDLPSIPEGVLVGWLGDMVNAVAEATETAPELAAAMGLGVVATSVQGRFRVQVKPGYTEPLCLWPCPAMESGSRKTEVMRLMTEPLRDWERDEAERLRPEVEKDRATRKVEEARIKNLTHQAAKAKDPAQFRRLQDEVTALQADLHNVRVLPRLFTSDATPEQLAVLLEQHGERMAYISDEGGVVEIMAGRYSAGMPNLDVFLQGHSGSSVRVDRSCRDSVLLNSPTLSVVLSPQPDVLQDLFSRRVFRGRGLLARFLFLLPKSLVGHRTGETDPVPPFIRAAYANGIRTLLDHPPSVRRGPCADPVILTLADEARQQWHEFFLRIDREMRPGERFEHLRDWANKLPGAAARIAALLHLAEQVEPVEGAIENIPAVGAETMERAIRIGEFLATHALAVYRYVGADPAESAAQKVLDWLNRERAERVPVRELYHGLKGTFPRMKDLRPALNTLVEHGHAREIDPPSSGSGRRKGKVLLVNPKVVEGWSA